jgi:hypothetical protein
LQFQQCCKKSVNFKKIINEQIESQKANGNNKPDKDVVVANCDILMEANEGQQDL